MIEMDGTVYVCSFMMEYTWSCWWDYLKDTLFHSTTFILLLPLLSRRSVWFYFPFFFLILRNPPFSWIKQSLVIDLLALQSWSVQMQFSNHLSYDVFVLKINRPCRWICTKCFGGGNNRFTSITMKHIN